MENTSIVRYARLLINRQGKKLATRWRDKWRVEELV
jgi:hypothetical protein